MRFELEYARLRLPLKRLVCGGGLFCLSLAANAMDLLQAYEAARSSDAGILAARASAAADREGLPQARAQFFPNVNANVSRTNNRLTSTTPDFQGTERTVQSEYPSESQSLTLRQPLFRPQLLAQYRQTQAQVDDSEAALLQEEQNLATRITGAYFDAMLSRDQLSLVMAQQKTLVVQLDLARKSFAGGSGVRTDVDEAQARLDMNRAAELEARQYVAYTLQQLQAMMAAPLDGVSALNVSRFSAAPLEPAALDAWVDRAVRSSPQLRSLLARVEVAREEVKKASAGHYPTVDAVLQWSNSLSDSTSNLSTRYINHSAGVQVNIPLFAGGYVSSQVRQALLRQERAEQALEAGRRDLQVRVYKEFRSVTESAPKIAALEQALRSSDQLVLSSRKSFEAGSRTVLDIMNAEQQRMVVQRDLAQARYLYLASKMRLLALSGAADGTTVATINQVLQP
ncbi:MAG: TolC family outer membrane protein [Burkholderiales bacterium]|nr:TolC family outer membrane protein [Burkholderiales bacterium]